MNRVVRVVYGFGEYKVHIGEHLAYGELLLDAHKACKVVLVSDDTVVNLYGEHVKAQLEQSGFEVFTFVIKHGEGSKNWENAGKILDFCADARLSKGDILAALGGGVVGDITGFVAAVLLRGVPYVQLPTTLLAAVDSSVGGKTAVDLDSGKNLAGAFHQPIAVLCDTSTFSTLPKRIFSDGMAEVIKYGVIRDPFLFSMLEEENYDIIEIVERCVRIKAEIVEADEFDLGVRRLLNYGHTPGHAVELLSDYTISHGSAISIGMVIMTRFAEQTEQIEAGSTKRLIHLLEQFDLPISCHYSAAQLAQAALMDKKRMGDTIALVVPNMIGEACVCEYDTADLESIFYTKAE